MGITSMSMSYPDIFKDKIPFHITESGALVGGGLRVNDCPSEWLLGSPPVFQEEGC